MMNRPTASEILVRMSRTLGALSELGGAGPSHVVAKNSVVGFRES